MNTQEYLALLRKKTGYNDYKIAQEFDINQSNLSKYSRGVATLSETHAFLFAQILELDPAQIIADTKLEHAISKQNTTKIKFWQNYVNLYAKPIKKTPKIAIAQINPTLADLENNANLIINSANEAKIKGANLIIFPELATSGYLPEDLLLRSKFIKQIIDINNFIIKSLPKDMWIIFGSINVINDKRYNAAFVIYQQSIKTIYHKQKLPNYGVFDEKRYFSTGKEVDIIQIEQYKIALTICEDIWSEDIIAKSVELSADMIISINASPFSVQKHQKRLEQIKFLAKKYHCQLVYVNCIGGQDELVFDGGSFVVDELANIKCQLPFFKPCLSLIDYKKYTTINYLEQKLTYDALVLATKDYVIKNGFNKVVLGLSGGIDSALTLAIAVDALGADNVEALLMPSAWTADISLLDAQKQANTMNVIYNNIPINTIVESFEHSLASLFAGLKRDITEENIQARIRGSLLMAISNKTGAMPLATGNKSEYAVGYTTLYGDMNGGFAPLKDVYKTQVYALAKYRNNASKVIPQRTITRAPTAELSPNQTDQDTLPDYATLDAILARLLENRLSSAEIINQGFVAETVHKVAKMVLKSEYKRRQSPPGVKISANAFGRERRYPITSKFKM